MSRVGNAGAWGLPFALVIALAISASSSPVLAILHQGESAAIEIGAGPIREPALAIVGRAIYRADSIAVFGYFAAIEALDPGLLFAAPTHSEATARFTYAGEIAVPSRADRGDVTSLGGEGRLQVYLAEAGGASWNDPASFAQGQELAQMDIVMRQTLHRQGPGTGLVVGDDQLTQVSTNEFTLSGETYRFGETGITQRLRTVGAIVAADPAEPTYTVSVSGTASVSNRPATPVRLGLSATPAASAATPAAACTELDQWLTETQARLARADELAAAPEVAGESNAIDVEAARAAADEVATLATDQRTVAVPAGGEEANRLAVTALSTYARGLQNVKDGAAAGNADLVAQGQVVVADGRRLGERALQALYGLGVSCPDAG